MKERASSPSEIYLFFSFITEGDSFDLIEKKTMK